jgi:hypothetical protein
MYVEFSALTRRVTPPANQLSANMFCLALASGLLSMRWT